MKRVIIAIVCLFVLWSAMDVIIHGVILSETYASQPDLWRPPGEMNLPLIYLAVLIWSVAFAAVYTAFFKRKGPGTGLAYGIIMGIASGFSMGFCTYASMPVPMTLAVVWFLGAVVEISIGGLLLGFIVKD